MKRRIYLSILILLVSAFLCSSPVSAWNFDKMISHVEKKLSIAEKQATVIIKMLNSDKHLAKLQSDIDRIRTKGGSEFKAKDTYLYSVLRKIENGEIAFEKSALTVTVIWDAKRYTNWYTQPLYPLFLVSFASGNYKGLFRNEISKNKDFLKNKEKADALVILCKKLIEIQKPVLFLAREKLNVDGIRSDQNGGTCTGKVQDWKAINVYGFLFPATVREDLVYYKAVMDKEDYLAAYPISYIKYLQLQAEFLRDLGFKTNYGTTDWDKYIAELGKILEDKGGNFDDIKSEGKKATQVESKDKDLNIDDLKLPK